MPFVTSRNFVLPETAEGLTSGLWFNLWPNKLWPYNELELGDTVYWYQSPNKCIVWRSRVVDINRFAYRQKDQVQGDESAVEVLEEQLEAVMGAPVLRDDIEAEREPEEQARLVL